ncbi:MULTISPECIES: SulP family inorganic anion transporter [unclassified Methylibium]|uniref:SulP family inorganic anion transporter n=1 Tax=unclassified Methylibium TaxID=2633235 RepID=UPI0006F89AC0|nr:SulP family inorganic anion transporter [Methylibium sp. Root1272]KQW66110.1 sulfate permease [Methylibium sp. Root1272]
MTSTDRWLARLLPMLQWWPMVNRRSLRADLLAGLTGTIILVPQAVAYASIAGLPPAYGLYTAIVPVIVASLFGSSLHLVSGPTAALSIVIFATLSPLAEPGSAVYIQLALSLTFMTGLLMLAMGLARLGVLVNFISHSVVIGFTAGAAVLIATSQLKNFFGVTAPATSSFIETLSLFAQRLPDTNFHVLSVGVVTLLTAVGTRAWLPRVPHMIVAMLVGSLYALALTTVFGPAAHIAMVSAIPRSLPPLSMPIPSGETLRQLAPIALALAMLSLTEAVAIARAIALKSGQRIDSSQEFIGQGLANVVGSFASSYVSSGSFTRSGVNYTAGAKTPLAPVFSALFLVVTLVALAPLVRYLPIASMAAILLVVAYSLVDVHHIRGILRTSRAEAAVLGATFLATLFLHLEFAIYVGVLLSLMVFLERTARPDIRDAVPAPGEHSYHFVPQTTEPDCCQLKMVFIDGPIYFGAVDHVQRRLRDIDAVNPGHKHLLVLAPGVNFIDSSGAELLGQEARRRRQIGGGLYFHRLHPSAVDVLERAGHLDAIGRENLHAIGTNVIDAIYPRLDVEVCRHCPARIFSQCQHVLPNGEAREPAADPRCSG